MNGIDVISIERIKRAAARSTSLSARFLKRVFTDPEIRYSFSKKTPCRHLALRWAAKEAFFKAAGQRFAWKDVEVLKKPTGAPFINVRGRAKKSLKSKNPFLSMAYAKDIAISIVVIE